jgi:nitrilase
MSKTIKVAVVQAASVLFNKEKTVSKAVKLIEEASKKGVELVLFPEAFIPAYPHGLTFGTVVGNRTREGRYTWQRYWENCIMVPGPETDILGETARENNVYLAMGVIEKDSEYSQGTVYCTLIYIGSDGKLLGKHRKLKPTAGERLIWGEGDGSTLTVIESDFAKIGGLICWENYMPLARMAMYGKGVEIYVAPTADQRDQWHATMRHIACEGRCFVLGCNQYVTKDMYPEDLIGVEELEGQPEEICRGGSTIISPLGEVIAGPLYGEEGILYADLDMDDVARGKLDFDVVGHYARPDVFKLIINEKPSPPISYEK